jgi:putative ABC transport system permease protein
VQITTLTREDAEALQNLPNIRAAYAGTLGQERALHKNVNKQILLFGTGYEAPEVDTNLAIAEGRFFTQEEESASDKVVVLGKSVKETFFGDGNAVGEKITLKGERYRVIGITESRGTAGFIDLDTFVYIPVTTLQKRILGVDYVQMISVRMSDTTQETATIQDIEALLRNRHDIDDPEKDDFSVTSTEEAKEVIGTTLDALTWLLLSLTAISLVVGGVGVMNVLYVSVAERTSEIGLRKAVGATKADILSQFLIEALLVTLIGGCIGVALGVAITFIISLVAAEMGYGVSGIFTLASFLLSVAFALFVGIVFGFAPALRASQLSPIEALRKE